MKLTGKCKEDFEKWYNEIQKYNIGWFYRLQPEYQYGVLVDFFDSVGIDIMDGRYGFQIKTKEILLNEKTGDTRPKSRPAAIEKANELYNL
jgi:hypothetical protein